MVESSKQLTVLWTSGNPVTAKNMVFMYVINAKKFGWWDDITLIIWGASAQLAADRKDFQPYFQSMHEVGVDLVACKACADDLGVTEQLEALGVEVKYMGTGLTEVLQGQGKFISI
ncbi:MAG: DsrE family protein [Anaerolineae bacterium]|jgi:hypothetical protein|nr:DsrE family protein [Anaerolineae bacterium]